MASFNIDGITAKLNLALATTPSLADLRDRITEAQHRADDVLRFVHLPHLPTRDEIWARATSMFVKTRSLDEIVERAHRMILEAVGTRPRSRRVAYRAEKLDPVFRTERCAACKRSIGWIPKWNPLLGPMRLRLEGEGSVAPRPPSAGERLTDVIGP